MTALILQFRCSVTVNPVVFVLLVLDHIQCLNVQFKVQMNFNLFHIPISLTEQKHGEN